MRRLLFITLLFLVGNISAQEEFSFHLYFEDAVGNKDTLTIGYDPLATDTIDASFGEVNIISQPWDTLFEVRVTDEFFKRRNEILGTYHTKKQIVLDNCAEAHNQSFVWYSDIVSIDIRCEHYPLLISWNADTLNSECRKGSFLTSMIPGGWFDTGGYKVNMANSNQYTFYNDSLHHSMKTFYQDGGKDIHTMWFVFADSTALTASVDNITSKMNPITVFPMPFKNQFKVEGIDLKESQQIKIFNTLGMEQEFQIEDNSIILNESKSGVYFLQFTQKGGRRISLKLIKD